MNLNINIEKIFNLYDIHDEEYLNSCKNALKLVMTKKELQDIVEALCNDLYNTSDYSILEGIRAKTYEEIFGEYADNWFLTNLVALIGLAEGSNEYEEKEIIQNILYYGKSGMRVRQMVFLSHIIGDRMIALKGFRFQYVTGKKGVNVLVHISREADLEEFLEVVSRETEQIKVKWNLEDIVFECESWLLSKEIVECLSENSHILAFQKNFNICRGANCNVDILKFVFGVSEITKNVEYLDLEENTSLQKKIKAMLLNGTEFYYGVGTLVKNS